MPLYRWSYGPSKSLGVQSIRTHTWRKGSKERRFWWMKRSRYAGRTGGVKVSSEFGFPTSRKWFGGELFISPPNSPYQVTATLLVSIVFASLFVPFILLHTTTTHISYHSPQVRALIWLNVFILAFRFRCDVYLWTAFSSHKVIHDDVKKNLYHLSAAWEVVIREVRRLPQWKSVTHRVISSFTGKSELAALYSAPFSRLNELFAILFLILYWLCWV